LPGAHESVHTIEHLLDLLGLLDHAALNLVEGVQQLLELAGLGHHASVVVAKELPDITGLAVRLLDAVKQLLPPPFKLITMVSRLQVMGIKKLAFLNGNLHQIFLDLW
jgi:hypothetical protein